MSSLIIIFVFLSILFGGTVFIVTTNLFFALGVFILSIIYFFVLAFPKIKKSGVKTNRFHECYNFINSFIIALSIKKSLKAAYDDTLITMSKDFQKIDKELIDLNYDEKLNYLSTVYPFHIYSLFMNIISLWSEEGGDIIKMSTQLINETRNVEDYLLACERMSKRKYIEFSVLWIITIAIMIFLKFALKDFYTQLQNQIFFPIAISSVFIFILISIHILINVTTSIELKGWTENEKKS